MKMDMLRFIAAAIIAVSAASYLVPPCQCDCAAINTECGQPYQCDCAAINTECGQPGTFGSIKEWEKTLEKEGRK